MKSFTQIVILGSSSFVPFMQLTTNVRREVIEDLLDIRVFSSMALLLKDRVATNREEYKLNEQAIRYAQDAIKTQEKLRAEIDEQRESKIADYNVSIMRNEEDISVSKIAIEEYQEEINNLLEQCADYDSIVGRIHKIVSLEQNLESKKSNANKSIKFYTENDECPTCAQLIEETIRKSKIDEKKSSVEEIKEALTRLEDEHRKAEHRHSEIRGIQADIRRLQAETNRFQSSIESYQKEIAIWNKEIANLNKTQGTFTESAILSSKLELDKALSSKEQILTDKEMYELATVILRDSGIKSRIIKQYIPVINTLVNKYLAAMDFFVKFELNEQFEEKILSRHRDDFTYESFSEGEKMRIDLSLLFTWRAIARMKNSASTNLLILDEVFDASLDANGCDEFLKLIHDMENTNIFVISHKGDVLNDKFSNVLRFAKQKNFSRIV